MAVYCFYDAVSAELGLGKDVVGEKRFGDDGAEQAQVVVGGVDPVVRGGVERVEAGDGAPLLAAEIEGFVSRQLADGSIGGGDK